MSINKRKTREKFPLSTKKIIKKTIFCFFIYLFFAIFLFFLFIFLPWLNLSMNQNASQAVLITDFLNQKYFNVAVLIYLFLLLIVTALTYFYQKWYFSVYDYKLTNDSIVIKKGPIAPIEIIIPFEKIQNIYIDQDILDNIFGLYNIHISTAVANSGSKACINGVDRSTAEALKTTLLSRCKNIKTTNN